MIRTYTHSITRIPQKPGTYWIKGKTFSGKRIVLDCSHEENIYFAIKTKNTSDYGKYCSDIVLEILLDEESNHFQLAAG